MSKNSKTVHQKNTLNYLLTDYSWNNKSLSNCAVLSIAIPLYKYVNNNLQGDRNVYTHLAVPS